MLALVQAVIPVLTSEWAERRLWIVELELLPAADEAALGALAAALEGVAGLSADPTTKLERALDMLAGAGART